MKRLKFARFHMEPVCGPQPLLTVKFLDDAGQVYSWAPALDDAEQLFLTAIKAKASYNQPEDRGQPIQMACKVCGTFGAFADGELIIFTSHEDLRLTPGFPVTVEFLDTWLDHDVEVLIINGSAVQVRHERSGEIYPKPQTSHKNHDDSPL